MKYYIYTIPKAGTYLMAAILEQAGLGNSGWHIMVHEYLDTLSHDLETNSETPTQTHVRGNYVNRFRRLRRNQFCFGHLSPTCFPLPVASRTGVLRCYRHPRAVLESEFVDFRFRRTDLVPFSPQSIEADDEAFSFYIAQRGEKMRRIYVEFLLYEKLIATKEYQELLGHNCIASIDLDDLRDPDTGYETCQLALSKLGLGEAFSEEKFRNALAQNTKTNSAAVSKDIDRSSFWSETSEAAYLALDLASIYEQISVAARA